MAGARLGIDVGGTFIDLVLEDQGGRLFTEKVLSRPSDLVAAITDGVERLLAASGVDGTRVGHVVHAMTLGSNAVLERRGARTALITTRGFRDVLQIQRSVRWSMYDVQIEKPRPLVPRSLTWEVTERCRADGSVLQPLDEEEVAAVARELAGHGIEAVAVAYLHAYANPAHERRTREVLAAEAPGIPVTLSSDVSQQGREYERTNTAVVNAYITKVLGAYLRELEAALPRLGIDAPLWIMQSSGGLAPVGRTLELPVRTVESGPAAGALMSAFHGAQSGLEDVISFDMGGTTAKASVIRGGRPTTTRSFELERVELRRGSGLPLDIPAIDLVEVGAGGGSIASAQLGVLQVGPRSAGADPGPACYARGGEEPTVTDANLLLGYLNPDRFAGGAFGLDVARSEAAVDRLAAELGLERLRAAWGIHEVVNLEMERAIRLVSINRGLDPRDYAMVALGGAAPSHATRLARALGIARVVVPWAAGVGSARGLLEAGESYEAARTALVQLDRDGAAREVDAILEQLEAEARATVGTSWGGEPRVLRTAGLRYRGQGYELEVPLEEGPVSAEGLERAFHAGYERAYGYREDQPVEGVSWYVTLTHAADPVTRTPPERPGAAPAPRGTRRAYFPETGEIEVAVLDRAALRPGDSFEGPAVVEEDHTSTVIQPGDRVQVDAQLALTVEVADG